MFVRGLLKATKSTTSIKRIQSLVRKPISSSRLFSTSTNQTTNQTNQSTSSSLKNQTLTQQQQSQLNANSNEIGMFFVIEILIFIILQKIIFIQTSYSRFWSI